MRGLSELSDYPAQANHRRRRDPSSGRFAATFSRKGEGTGLIARAFRIHAVFIGGLRMIPVKAVACNAGVS
jgi:hypothetical protein